jgi:hypothetical protein
MAEQEYQMNREKFSEWKKENAEKAEFASQMTDWYNIGADISGKPKLTTDKIAMMLKFPGPQAKEAQTLMELGFQNLNSGFVKFGASPAAVVELTQNIKAKLPEHLTPIYSAAFEAMRSPEIQATIDPKNPAAVSAKFNEIVKLKASQYQAGVDYKDNTNPYILPSPKIVGQNPEVGSTRLWQNVIAPAVAAGTLDTSDPNKVIALGLEAMKSGKIGLKELAYGIQTYYSVGKDINNVGRDFYRYAIPEQVDYKAKVELPSVFGQNVFMNKITVDLNDPVMVNNYLVQVIGSPAGILKGY